MAGPGICVLCLADTCTSEVHPVFNPVAPYGYLLSDLYLFMADITNPDFLVLSCRTWIGLDITRFCEQQRQPSSGSAWPACPKNGKSGPHCWGRGGSTQFAQQLEFAVTAPPLVGCVVWSLHHMVTTSIRHKHQETTDNTKHCTQNSNWVHNRYKHTTSTRRNTHTTHKETLPTTRIIDKKKITTPHTPTTLHHNTTQQTHPDVINIQQHGLHHIH